MKKAGSPVNDTEDYEALNPFTAIWMRPRAVVRYVIEEKSLAFLFLVIVLAGFAAGLFSSLSSGQEFSVWGTLLSAVFFGPIGLVASTALGAAIYLLIGKLFKGKSTYTEMFKAILTGQIPQIWLIPIHIVWMLMIPETYFLQPGELPFSATDGLSLIFYVILGIVTVWNLFVLCKAIAEAHRFSAWKGFFVILIPTVLTLAVIAGLLVFFFMVFLPLVAGGN